MVFSPGVKVGAEVCFICTAQLFLQDSQCLRSPMWGSGGQSLGTTGLGCPWSCSSGFSPCSCEDGSSCSSSTTSTSTSSTMPSPRGWRSCPIPSTSPSWGATPSSPASILKRVPSSPAAPLTPQNTSGSNQKESKGIPSGARPLEFGTLWQHWISSQLLLNTKLAPRTSYFHEQQCQSAGRGGRCSSNCRTSGSYEI